MRDPFAHGKLRALERQAGGGISRRDFIKFCAVVSAAMGSGAIMSPEAVAQALTSKKKPTVVYVQNSECTGCVEAILRHVEPYIDELVLDILNISYIETLQAAAGERAEEALEEAIKHGDYICVVEGAIPMADKGIYGMIAGTTMYDLTKHAVTKAKAVISIGNCASFGNIPAAKPNPTGCVGVNEAYGSLGVKAINIAGCPPNPINFVGTVVHLLEKGMPELDEQSRPLMFFGKTVHEQCQRLKFFEEDKFAPSFDSEEARKGYCLYMLGCKGPYTYNNCPTAKFNQVNWPVQAGHPCIGCSEPAFWDELSPFYEPI